MEWIAQNKNYCLPLPPHPIASRQAHKVLELALVDWRVCGDPADDAHVVLGELVTNALMHSMDVFTLALNLYEDRILIEVWDCVDAVPEVRMPDGQAIDGRGMFLVDVLANRWGVRSEGQGGKTVWATISLGRLEPVDSSISVTRLTSLCLQYPAIPTMICSLREKWRHWRA